MKEALAFNLKTGLAFALCLVAAAGAFALAYFSLSHFQRQLRENVAAQQFVLVSSIAGHIDDNLVLSQGELVQTAKSIPLEILEDSDRTTRFLEAQSDHKITFDNAVALFSRDGRHPQAEAFAAIDRSRRYLSMFLSATVAFSLVMVLFSGISSVRYHAQRKQSGS